MARSTSTNRERVKMKSYKPITFASALRDVHLVAATSPSELERRGHEAEQAAYERGRRDAEKALSEQLLQQRTELLALHQGVIESLRTSVPLLVREAESALIDLAMEAAGKVVAGVPVSRQTVEAVVREALGQVEDTSEISIQLNPDDLALLRKHKSPILEGLPETGPLRFTASPEVTPGGCLIHTRFGQLDARRETKLEQLRQSAAA
jgi:flagellar biosynthesis/type III secretory pathway protein FliH